MVMKDGCIIFAKHGLSFNVQIALYSSHTYFITDIPRIFQDRIYSATQNNLAPEVVFDSMLLM